MDAGTERMHLCARIDYHVVITACRDARRVSGDRRMCLEAVRERRRLSGISRILLATGLPIPAGKSMATLATYAKAMKSGHVQ